MKISLIMKCLISIVTRITIASMKSVLAIVGGNQPKDEYGK